MSTVIIESNWDGNTTAGAPALYGAAGSLITALDFCLVTTLGWTKPFSGTNLAAYKMPGGSQSYFYVDDTGTQTARAWAYASMSSISVGLGRFPRDAQMAGGGYIWKSTTSDSTTARQYLFASNGRFFTLIIKPSNALSYPFQFGDVVSMVYNGEAYPTVYISLNDAAAPSAVNTRMWQFPTSLPTWAASGCRYMSLPIGGIGAPVQVSLTQDLMRCKPTGALELGYLGKPFPDPIDGGVSISRVYVLDPTFGPRAYLPGCAAHNHSSTDFAAGAVITTSLGTSVVRTYEVGLTPNSGSILIETSDTWDT